MEQRMMISQCKRGFILVTVLIVTAVGLLFGAGALLLFRFQCQLRIDRQHELEKIYAVRSALNYIRTTAYGTTGDNGIPVEGRVFGYHTQSERNLKLLVKPVAPIFPNTNDLRNSHFVMERGDLKIPLAVATSTNGWYSSDFDYECGVSGDTKLNVDSENYIGNIGLKFGDATTTNGVRWWVNIGMRGTGGWPQPTEF